LYARYESLLIDDALCLLHLIGHYDKPGFKIRGYFLSDITVVPHYDQSAGMRDALTVEWCYLNPRFYRMLKSISSTCYKFTAFGSERRVDVLSLAARQYITGEVYPPTKVINVLEIMCENSNVCPHILWYLSKECRRRVCLSPVLSKHIPSIDDACNRGLVLKTVGHSWTLNTKGECCSMHDVQVSVLSRNRNDVATKLRFDFQGENGMLGTILAYPANGRLRYKTNCMPPIMFHCLVLYCEYLFSCKMAVKALTGDLMQGDYNLWNDVCFPIKSFEVEYRVVGTPGPLYIWGLQTHVSKTKRRIDIMGHGIAPLIN
jgi:hypothetical protein